MECVFDTDRVKAYVEEPRKRTLLVRDEMGGLDFHPELHYIPRVCDVFRLDVTSQRLVNFYFGQIDDQGSICRLGLNYMDCAGHVIYLHFLYCLGLEPAAFVSSHHTNVVEKVLNYFWSSIFDNSPGKSFGEPYTIPRQIAEKNNFTLQKLLEALT